MIRFVEGVKIIRWLGIQIALAGGNRYVLRWLYEDGMDRFSRQKMLPEFGEAGQRALCASRVLIVGAGGLGCPTMNQLAAAGVGNITVVDDDRVELSNIHRQTLYGEVDVGGLKVEVAAAKLAGMYPHLNILPVAQRFAAKNSDRLVGEHDLVLDCTDNFPTRYLINEACLNQEVPFVSASIYRFEGQISLFATAEGPCYRCLFPQPAATGNCQEGGVLGPFVSVVGSLQALASVHYLSGSDHSLAGRLCLIDGISFVTRSLSVSRDPSCPSCGPKAGRFAAHFSSDLEISWRALEDLEDEPVLIDVRSAEERARGCIKGSLHLEPGDFMEFDWSRLQGSPIFYCASGARSLAAATRVRTEFGRVDARSLRGGFLKVNDSTT